MPSTKTVTCNLGTNDVAVLDKWVQEGIYISRSDAIRHCVRTYVDNKNPRKK
jgi:Arc/MetJ-type ribon-helix-helix transcriptional regulator